MKFGVILKLGSNPNWKQVNETLLGTLNYGPCRVATATMGYKYETLDLKKIAAAMNAPIYLLKIIPSVDGTLQICELIRNLFNRCAYKGSLARTSGA